MKKKILLLMVVITVIFFISAEVDFIICTVNGEAITYLNFMRTYKRNLAYATAYGYDVKQITKQKIIDDMIDTILIKQKAGSLGISVSDDEINMNVKRIMDENGWTKEQFIEQLKYAGYSYQEYLDDQKLMMLRYRFMQDYIAHLAKEPTIDQMKDFYEKNKEKYKASYQYAVYQMKLDLPSDAQFQEKLQGKKAIAELKTKIDENPTIYNYANIKDIEQLMAKIANDYQVELYGEKINYYPEIEDKTFMSNFIFVMPGQTSKAFLFDNDYYVMIVISREKIDYIPFEDIKTKIYNYLEVENQNQAYTDWIKKEREEAVIFWYRKDIITE